MPPLLRGFALCLLLLATTPCVAVAQDATPEQCSTSLEASRERLRAIAADLARDGLTQATAQRIVAWSQAFRGEVTTLGLGGRIEAMAVGTGGSVLASVALGGPPGWGAAALGAVIGILYVEAKAAIQVVANWTRVDANTAFYQYLLDYLEYGRVGDVQDPHLRRFIGDYGGLLGQLTGAAPPSDPAALHRYLQAHAESLMLYFGYFEETAGAAAFPRWRFPQTQGRFGHSRLDVGYFRKLLAERLVEQLRQLDREIALLQETSCRETPTAPVPMAACAGPPKPGESLVCACSVTTLATVWGVDLYTDDSGICAAAVHVGLVRPRVVADGSIAYAGIVEVSGQKGCPYYGGSVAFGVSSKSYGAWGGSFFFPAVQRGLCDPASRPAEGSWYCPLVLPANANDLTCHCTPHATELGSVWGSAIYTDDSAICRAARHAGRIGPIGGSVRVLAVGGLDSYESTEANGIRSSGYGPWARSIGFP